MRCQRMRNDERAATRQRGQERSVRQRGDGAAASRASGPGRHYRGLSAASAPLRRVAGWRILLTVGALLAAPAAADPFSIPPELRQHAVLSCGDLQIAGASVVTSDGLLTGAAVGEQGHVRSNGDVMLDGGVTVHGDAIAGPGRQVVRNGKPSTVTGESHSATETFDCSPIDLAALAAELETVNDNALLTTTDKGKPALSGSDGRSLVLSGRDGLTLPAGTYLLSELRLTGNSSLRLDGAVRLLVTGDVSLGGGSHVHLDGDPYLLRLWSRGDVSVASNSILHGFVHAPDGEVALAGQSKVVGGIQAGAVSIVGGSRVRRVVDDEPPLLEILRPVAGTTVEQCEIEVEGRASDGQGGVEVTVDAVVVAVEEDGGFVATTSLWTDDPGLIVVTATDAAGNVTRQEVRVAIAPPAVALVTPAPGSLVGTRLVDLAGTAVAATEVSVNDVPAELPGDGMFRLTGFDLGEAEGLVTLRFLGRNCGGERSSTAVLDLDTRAPVVAIDSPAGGSILGSSPLTVSGTVQDEHLDGVTVNGVAARVEGERFTAEGVSLAEGANLLVARAVDLLGRATESAPVEVELDTTAPTVTILSPAAGSLVATPAVDVSGEVSDPNLAAVVVNGVTASVSGTTFTAVGVPLTEGESFLVAEATDALGNSATSPSVVVTLDTLPPVITVATEGLPELTAETALTLSGSVEEPHLDRVTVGGVTAVVAGDDWVAADVPLAEGANELVAEAVDLLGHAASAPAVVVVSDTTAPVVAITEPAAGAPLTSRQVAVRGTVDEPHLARVTVLGVEATVAGGTFEATVELPEGPSDLAARAVDLLGHVGDAEPVPVVVDTQAPVVRLDSPANPLVATATVTVSGRAEDPHLDTVRVGEIEAAVAADGTFAVPDVALVEGSNEITATASDTFGHQATSEPVLYVLDTTAPVIELASPVEGQVVAGLEVVVSGRVVEPHLESITVNGLEAPADAEGLFELVLPLPEGASEIVVVATDLAGHTSEARVTVVRDVTPPAVSIDLPAVAPDGCLPGGVLHDLGGRYAEPSPATGEGGQPPPVVVEVRRADGTAITLVGELAADGASWSVGGVDLGQSDGVVTATVIGTDLFGNVGRATSSWRLDATAPTLELTLDGAPFPGSGPGAAPPPGTVPALFGRAVAVGARVADGALAAPPRATLTLDGALYAAGTPIAAEGGHLVVATVTDCAGHTTVAHAAFVVDLTAPPLLASVPAAGARLTTAPGSFSGTSSNDLATATVNGEPAAVSGDGFQLAPFPWREGDNRVRIELVDRAGNRALHEVSFAVRTTPLAVEILESGVPLAPGTVFLRPVRPEVRASDSGAEITATLGGAPFTSGSEVAVSGTHTLAATVRDDWGRTASASVTFDVDLADGPAISVVAPVEGAVLAEPQVDVTGTVSGEQVTVTVNGAPASVSGGTWSLAGLPLEGEGPVVVEAVARDHRGRTASESVQVVLQTGGPQILLLDPADGASTNLDRIDVVGVVVGGGRRAAGGSVTVGGVAAALAGDGSFRAADVPLAAGENVVTARFVDAAGAEATATVRVFSDGAPPTITFFAGGEPLRDGASFSAAFTLAVDVADDTGPPPTPLVRLNGDERPEAATPRTTLEITEPGGYVVAVVARDVAGNEARAERSFVLDSGGCAVVGVHPAAGATVAAPAVTLTGRSGAAAAITVRVPDGQGGVQEFAAALADGTFLAGDVPLPVIGENLLELVCTDASGGQETLTHPLQRVPVGSGPEVAINSPAEASLVGGNAVAVAGTASAGQVSVNGLAATMAAGTPAGFTVAAVPLTEGPNVLAARAVDSAGRVGEDRVVVERDSRAPQLQITRPDHRSTIGIAGDGPAVLDVSGLVDLATEPHLDRVVVTTGLGEVVATVDPATGAFLARDVPLDAAAGAATLQLITASATDLLGHTGSATAEVLLDPTGPAIVLSTPDDLTRYGEGSPEQIAVAGEAWAREGASLSLNGLTLDPATLEWGPAAADGRHRVAFSASVALPATEGAFGLIARVTELEGAWAQDRRRLHRDVTPPSVVETIPGDGDVGVDRHSLLLVLFSEAVRHASLEAVDGITLTRESTGERVVATRRVAGQAVALVPGAALAAGESYLLRAGSDVRDLAGLQLAQPVEVRFTVAAATAAAAPVLDPLPPVVCAESLAVTGSAGPGAAVQVRVGDLAFSSFADDGGRFAVTVPLAGNGFHLLRVRASDPATGATSAEASVVVRVDCHAPAVAEAALDRDLGRITVGFTEAMAPATLAVGGAGASLRLTDAEVPGAYQAGSLATISPTAIALDLDPAPDAWWRGRPVRLEVGPPAADAEGNPMAATFAIVFFPDSGTDLSGGFLSGEVWDEATGRPLAAATVRLFAAGAALPGAVPPAEVAPAVAGASTDGRGRFTLVGEVPAGRYILVAEKEGYSRVYRRLALRPAVGTAAFDSRLMPRAVPAGTLDPISGGTVASSSSSSPISNLQSPISLTLDPAALPGTAPVAVTLTSLSGQGLPDLLPLGWTPAAIAEIRLEQEGSELVGSALWTAGSALLELPLPAWVDEASELFAVRHDAASGQWLALASPDLVAGEGGLVARLAPAGAGTVALVVPDHAPETRPELPAAEGEALAGVARPASGPELTADLHLDPPVVPPTGRARARVVARSADGATAWPSGLAIQAYLEEKLLLTGGGQLLEAPFSADLVLYHPGLSGDEQGSAVPGAAGALEIVVSPSPRAAQVLLEVGFENIRLFPFPEEVERGPVVGPPGGTVTTPEGVRLEVPEAALSVPVEVSAELLSVAELAALPELAGYDTLAAVRVDLAGRTLGRPATLSLATPQGTPAEAAGDPRVLLVELVEAPADGRGTFGRLTARTRREGAGAAERIEASPALAGALPLEGLVREGLYLFVAARQPIGFATGLVSTANGSPLQHARASAEGLGTADLSLVSGRYAIPVSAGSERQVQALHPALGEAAAGTIASLAAGQVVTLDLTVRPVAPTVAAVFPADGAGEVPVGTAVSVRMSEAIDPSTVHRSTLTLELAGDDGGATGIFFDGTVALEPDGVTIVLAPSRPLPPGRTFRARFTGGVADAGGTLYAAAPVAWTFATSTVIVPGGQVHPERFRVRIPANGVAELVGDPGALPAVPAGSIPWAVTPEIEGSLADPLRETFNGRADGSFAGTVGHPPDFPVTLASRIWVKVFDPTGTLAAEFRLGPFESADGKAFVAPPGEAVTFTSAEGIVVDVPAAAFDQPTVVRVENRPLSGVGVPTPEGLALGAFVSVDFEGEARETLRLAVPAPAGAVEGAEVFVGAPRSFPWGRGLRFLTVGAVAMRGGQLVLTNDPAVQPEPATGTLSASAEGRLERRSGGRTCADVRDEGLSDCFLADLLVEFRSRSDAAWYYEQGKEWALLTGPLGGVADAWAQGTSAVLDSISGLFTFLTAPFDKGGRYVLPVLTERAFEVLQRDAAAGWILGREQVDALPEGLGFAEVPLGEETDPVPATLVDAHPFDLVRFAAPRAGESQAVRLDVMAAGSAGGLVELRSVSGYGLPVASSLALFDLAPLSLPRDHEEFGGPLPRGARVVCGDASWTMPPAEGSDQMLLIVGPGDLEPTAARFELWFDRPLRKVDDLAADAVARLHDLGPKDACSAAPDGAGEPIPLRVEIDSRGLRLVVEPLGPLPAGRRFRLELMPSGIRTERHGMSYWDLGSKVFDFATRAAAERPLGGIDVEDPLGSEPAQARDILQLGQLMMVATDDGELMAFDVSQPTEAAAFRRHGRLEGGLQASARTLATDGHNRVFWSGLFGSFWAVKALRLEDVREAAAPCAAPPPWAAGVPCFSPQPGSVRTAFLLGSSLTASEWLAAGTFPAGTPMDLEVLVQDEVGKTLGLDELYRTYGGSGALPAPDAEGIVTFGLELKTTRARGGVEPSLPEGPTIDLSKPWRPAACGVPQHDRFQRVTVENVTTGQSWSFDVENDWPDEGGSGVLEVTGLRARQGDRLRVRYNLRAIGYLAVMGSGITIVDLNRGYRVTDLGQGIAGDGQCGRKLGQLEGQSLEFPACAMIGSGPDGLSLTPSLTVHGTTGCATGNCRGEGTIDVYSPLINVGAVHSRTTEERPGGLGQPGAGEAAFATEVAACLRSVKGRRVLLRDIALANDVSIVDHGLRGDFAGTFTDVDGNQPPKQRRGDLLFATLGSAGTFVFDASERTLQQSLLVGHLFVEGHSAFRVQVDEKSGLVFVGGTDSSQGTPRPVVDVFDLRYLLAAPGAAFGPRPLASLDLPWATGNLGLDAAGTGLAYAWDGAASEPVAMPFGRPQFVLGGLYRPDGESDDQVTAESRPTSYLVPLGVPIERSPEQEVEKKAENESKHTAAFKVRIALPGSFGETLTARVQSLRALPAEHLLGRSNVGAAVALPGGPGWPDNEVAVTLRRVGVGLDESAAVGAGEGGQLGTAFNLYESEETILLLADPRARRGYRRQQLASGDGDEESQCRRCDWPSYLPDPYGEDPRLAKVEELLAGKHVRVFLAEDPASPAAVRSATRAAIDLFAAQGEAYPLPAGWARVAAAADAVPSPVQISLVEPAQNPAVWPGVAGIGAALTGGETLHATVDHQVAGRALAVSFDRSYRSHTLGYGPLGSAGWHGSLFAHVREIETTGDVEYHDGSGRVFRFASKAGPRPSGYAEGGGASYYPPEGLYLRLEKVGAGWRLLDRHHNELRFDRQGRLIEANDRHRQGAELGTVGSTIRYAYDGFGQLVTIVDDLGRRYRLRYHDDPIGDGARYGLLEEIEDFAFRTVEYVYDADRRLTTVRLPEVENPHFPELSFTGSSRPAIDYRYAPNPGVTTSESATGAVLHGEFAELRLAGITLPGYLEGGGRPERLTLGYEESTGRLSAVSEPGVAPWRLTTTAGGASPAEATVVVEAPWGHRTTHRLAKGRLDSLTEPLPVTSVTEAGEISLPAVEDVATAFSYTTDGRLSKVTHPDGGVDFWCYVDKGCEGEAAEEPDHLELLNLRRAGRRATTPEGAGGSPSVLETKFEQYHADNLVVAVSDQLQRRVENPVATVDPIARQGGTATRHFDHPEAPGEEPVAFEYSFDVYGRVKAQQGTGKAPPVTSFEYGEDDRGRAGAGLLEQMRQGSLSAEVEYDERGNVSRRRTSWGVIDEFDHDTWDRPIREELGIPGGAYAAPGACASGGARVTRGYDPAGHLVRERRLQDHLDASGSVACREVETRYRYNERQQLVAVEQSHLASPTPGVVDAGMKEVVAYAFDLFGRREKTILRNEVDADLVTTYAYDEAGRVATTKVGQSGVRTVGYDVKGRVVYFHDGDEGVVVTFYDAWDRPSREVFPTGAVVERAWDAAGNLARETTKDARTGKALAETRTLFNAFGSVETIEEVLERTESGEGDLEETVRRTAHLYDGSGRIEEVWAGTGIAAAERKIATYSYEPETGRLLAEGGGGEVFHSQPLFESRYEYGDGSPWPSGMTLLEAVPGQALQPTLTRAIQRDSFGRPVYETATDGTTLTTRYDRGGGAIQWETGAGTTWAVMLDAAGRVARELRPAGRGETRYGYDLDGRLLSEEKVSSGGVWTTRSLYDASRRLTAVIHPDGTSQTWNYRPDDVPLSWKTRDGVTVTYAYDAANRVTGAVPSAGEPLSVALDSGDGFDYDPLSRLVSARRDSALQSVAYEAYDLGSRPRAELVGDRDPLSFAYDAFDNPETALLPGGRVRPAGSIGGWYRQYDSLDRLEQQGIAGVASLSGIAPRSTPPGITTWNWGGAGRLHEVTTGGTFGIAAKFGYHGGPGPASSAPASAWRLGAIEWGTSTATLGRFEVGWRPEDGTKVSRPSGGQALAGMGWSYGYDAGLRLTSAHRDTEHFTFGYGLGDELLLATREKEGEVVPFTAGPDGRIASRDDIGYSYDLSGRRTEDERHVYTWSWRGELLSVLVKEGAEDPAAEPSPFAGHRVSFTYDATGRLLFREHRGRLPEGASEEARPFIELREYVWEGAGLSTEVAYGSADRTQPRWRKTYVPGPGGLDDAVQVMVEVEPTFTGSPYAGQTRLYTYLRDEMGTVVGLAAEGETATVAGQPPIPVRYLYTPYGEAFAEAGPQLLHARFDNFLRSIAGMEQTIADPRLFAPGAMVLEWSVGIDEESLVEGLVVEAFVEGAWSAMTPAEVVVAVEEPPGQLPRVVAMATSGWNAGSSYRVRVRPELRDLLSRGFGRSESLEWQIPSPPPVEPPTPLALVQFEKDFPLRFDSAAAAAENLDGRFPGGQSVLFQGAWVDPVTGLGYHRARWYDSRNASWLSEDPLFDIDSPNLYAFVAWSPARGTDPSGTMGLPAPVVSPPPSPPQFVLIQGGASTAGAAKSAGVAATCAGSLPLCAVAGGVGYLTGRLAGRYYEPVQGFTLDTLIQEAILPYLLSEEEQLSGPSDLEVPTLPGVSPYSQQAQLTRGLARQQAAQYHNKEVQRSAASTEGAAGSIAAAATLALQREISIEANRQAAVVDRFLRSSKTVLADAYRRYSEENPNFATLIRGRLIDRRMHRFFQGRFGDVPGVRIDQTIPGSESRLRPDLYFPDVEGQSVIFDVGGQSKVTGIQSYEGMADVLIPIVPTKP